MAEQVSQCLISPHMGTFANIGEGIFSSKKKINQLVITGERVMFFFV